MNINITIEVKKIEVEQAISLLASIESIEQQTAKKKRVKLTDEEKKERQRAARKKWREANREKTRAYDKKYRENNLEKRKASCRAASRKYRENNLEKERARIRFSDDRRNHAHIKGYEPSSEYKRNFNIRNVTDKGYLYLAHDRDTGALKCGCTMCKPQKRLSYYKSHESDGITFLKVSPLLNDVYNAEAAAHTMLRENVRPVTTANKFKTSTNPSAEWFQMNGKFTFEDVIRVFDTVSKQFACNKGDNK